MIEQSDYLIHCQRGDKVHIGPWITLRITHIHKKIVQVRIRAPLAIHHTRESAKPRKGGKR